MALGVAAGPRLQPLDTLDTRFMTCHAPRVSSSRFSRHGDGMSGERCGAPYDGRPPEIELPLVRYLEEFLAVADVIRQYAQVIAEPGMTIELARLPAQKGLMLAPAAGADEFEGFLYVLQADKHDGPRR
jgi:hypothetical protein